MKSNTSLSISLLITVLISACATPPFTPSTTSALTANTTINEKPLRPFDTQRLSVNGLQTLNEFIRADVRARLDEEAVGDADSSYDASTSDIGPAPEVVVPAEESANSKDREEEQPGATGYDEDTMSLGASDHGKFLWAKRSFGDAVRSNPSAGGVIVLYADENFYDINSLVRFIEGGRDLIAQRAEIGAERIQVVFGGYRSAAQVELWIVPYGASMPEFKVEDREKSSEPES